LVAVLLYQVLDPTQRLGCQEMGGYDTLRSHIFLSGIDWETLHLQKPPELLPYLPANSENSENLWSKYKVWFLLMLGFSQQGDVKRQLYSVMCL